MRCVMIKSTPKFRQNNYGFDGIVIVVEHPSGDESTELWTFADLAIAIDKFKTSHGYIKNP